jgi:hypothetical protein
MLYNNVNNNKNRHTTTCNTNKDDDMSINLPDHGIVSTQQEKVWAIEQSYRIARQDIILALMETLLLHAPGRWVCSSDLFNRETLPESISVAKFSMEMWKVSPTATESVYTTFSNEGQQQQTEVFFPSSNKTECLLRHKFSNGFFYYQACTLEHSSSSSSFSKLILQELVIRAIHEYSPTSTKMDTKSQSLLKQAMMEVVPAALANVVAANNLTIGIAPKVFVVKWKPQLATYIYC